MSARQSVLVTGGSGFIGTHLIEALIDAGASVTNLDIRRPNLPHHEPAWVRCDVGDGNELSDLVTDARPEVIFHLAAVADVAADPAALAINTVGLANVLAAARALDTAPLVIHFSTQYVVGPGYEATGPDDLAPYTGYGASKAASERLLHEQGNGLDWVIVRPTMVWGPWHPTFEQQLWRYLERGYYLHPAGDASRRSYGYVGNVVHQVLRLAELDRSLVSGRTLYVGDEPMEASIWLDAFSVALRGMPIRRAPRWLLRAMAEVGELSAKLGGPAPIDRGRYHRMTTDYVVPMASTFELVGRGRVSLAEGVDVTTRWMRARRRRSGLVMIGAFPPPLGGAATVTAAVHAALSAQGLDVHTVDTSGPSLSHVRSKLYHARRLVRNLHGVVSLAARARRTAAVYLVPDGGLGIWYSCALAAVARAIGTPVYLHHHSCRYVDSGVLAARLLTAMTRSRATHVFLTPGMAARFQQRYGPVNDLVVGNAWVTSDQPARAQLAPYRRAIRIGHLSNLCAEKGFFDVAASFDAVMAAGLAAELYVAGPILEDAVGARLEQLRRVHGDRVAYVGPIVGEEKQTFYATLDVFLFPTRFEQEAAPLVLFEAAAAGVPWLSVERGCIGELTDILEGRICGHNDEFADLVVGYLVVDDGDHDKDSARPLAADERSRIRARFLEARGIAEAELHGLLDAIARSMGNP